MTVIQGQGLARRFELLLKIFDFSLKAVDFLAFRIQRLHVVRFKPSSGISRPSTGSSSAKIPVPPQCTHGLGEAVYR